MMKINSLVGYFLLIVAMVMFNACSSSNEPSEEIKEDPKVQVPHQVKICLDSIEVVQASAKWNKHQTRMYVWWESSLESGTGFILSNNNGNANIVNITLGTVKTHQYYSTIYNWQKFKDQIWTLMIGFRCINTVSGEIFNTQYFEFSNFIFINNIGKKQSIMFKDNGLTINLHITCKYADYYYSI